jgi:hypothetical protein
MPTFPTPRTAFFGDPPSAGHEPDKADIVKVLEQLGLAASLNGRAIFRDTKTQLDGVTGESDDIGFVLDDDTDTGVYEWDTGETEWTKVSELPEGFAPAEVVSVAGKVGAVQLDAEDIAETATAKIMTDAERTKLLGVETGATANDTNAALRDRSTHTGVQPISTVEGLDDALATGAAALAAETARATIAEDILAGRVDDVVEDVKGKASSAALADVTKTYRNGVPSDKFAFAVTDTGGGVSLGARLDGVAVASALDIGDDYLVRQIDVPGVIWAHVDGFGNASEILYEDGTRVIAGLDLEPAPGGIVSPATVEFTFSEPVTDPSRDLFVTWCSDSETGRTLRFRPAGSDFWIEAQSVRSRELPESGGLWLHTAWLDGLTADTVYQYQVVGSFHADTVKTAQTAAPVISMWSDFQVTIYGPDSQLSVIGREVSAHADCDLMLINGDIANDEGRLTASWAERWVNLMKDITREWRTRDGAQYPMVATIGNHDAANAAGTSHAASGGNGTPGQVPIIFSWAYFDQHPTKFVRSAATLGIGNRVWLGTLETDHTVPVSDQEAWMIEQANAAGDYTHAFIAGHVPPFNPTGNQHFRGGERAMRRIWQGVQDAGNVRAWLAGHSHALFVTPKLRMDIDENVSSSDNDRRWELSAQGFYQIGNGPAHDGARTLSDERLTMQSLVDESLMYTAVLKRPIDQPESTTAFQVLGTGVTNPKRPLSHAWVITCGASEWTAEAVNTDGDLFYSLTESTV